MAADRVPRVSVVMPVRNGAPTVGAALASLLNQTLPEIEVVVVDDGSTDDTCAEVSRMADDRVNLVRLERPTGDLGMTLMEGVRRSRADFIARMDADDVSYPTRLERQLEAMEAKPDLVLLGTWVDAVDPEGNTTMVSRPPCDDSSIRFIVHYRCPFHHPTVMFRRRAMETAGGYRAGCWFAEDFDLWRRMTTEGRVANLPEVLLAQRYHEATSSGRHREEQASHADRIGVEELGSTLGHPVSPLVARTLRDQVGPAPVARQAVATLFALYRACAEKPAFENGIALRATAAREILAIRVLGGPLGGSLRPWYAAARISPGTAGRRLIDIARAHGRLRTRLRGLQLL